MLFIEQEMIIAVLKHFVCRKILRKKNDKYNRDIEKNHGKLLGRIQFIKNINKIV